MIVFLSAGHTARHWVAPDVISGFEIEVPDGATTFPIKAAYPLTLAKQSLDPGGLLNPGVLIDP